MLSVTVAARLAPCKAWHTATHNPQRDGAALRDETVDKHISRLALFSEFAATSHPGIDALALLEDPAATALTAFLDSMHAKGRSEGTRRCVCDSVLCYLRYRAALAATVTLDQAVKAVRRVRNSLHAAYEVSLRTRSDRESLEAQGKWADWPTLVAAAHRIIDDFHTLKRCAAGSGDSDGAFDPANPNSTARGRLARAAQDALVATLYVAVPPSRGLEMRTLQLPAPSQAGKSGRHGADLKGGSASLSEENTLEVDAHGDPVMVLRRYKTAKRYGTQTVPLPNTKQVRDLVAAVTTGPLRRALTCGKAHRFVFCRPNGEPFANASAWTGMLARLFADALQADDKRITVNVLRKSFLTAALPAATTVPARESLAAAMRHSTRVQKASYDATTATERVREACDVASAMFNACTDSRRLTRKRKLQGEEPEDFNLEGEGARAMPSGRGLSQIERHLHAAYSHSENLGHTEPEDVDELEQSDSELEEGGGGGPGGAEGDLKEAEGAPLHLVDRLLALRRRHGAVEYLVRWEGCDTEDDTWEPEPAMPPTCIREFFEQSSRRAACKVGPGSV